MGDYVAPVPAVALELLDNLNYDGDRDEQRARRSADCVGSYCQKGAYLPFERPKTGTYPFRGTGLFPAGAGSSCGCDKGSSAGSLRTEAAIASCLTSDAINCSLVRIPASMRAPLSAPISMLISLISRITHCGSAPASCSPFGAPASLGSKGRQSLSSCTARPLLQIGQRKPDGNDEPRRVRAGRGHGVCERLDDASSVGGGHFASPRSGSPFRGDTRADRESSSRFSARTTGCRRFTSDTGVRAVCPALAEGAGWASGGVIPSSAQIAAKIRLAMSCGPLATRHAGRLEQVGPLLSRPPAPRVRKLVLVSAAGHGLAREAEEACELGVRFDAEGGLCLGQGRVHVNSKSLVTYVSQP